MLTILIPYSQIKNINNELNCGFLQGPQFDLKTELGVRDTSALDLIDERGQTQRTMVEQWLCDQYANQEEVMRALEGRGLRERDRHRIFTYAEGYH